MTKYSQAKACTNYVIVQRIEKARQHRSRACFGFDSQVGCLLFLPGCPCRIENHVLTGRGCVHLSSQTHKKLDIGLHCPHVESGDVTGEKPVPMSMSTVDATGENTPSLRVSPGQSGAIISFSD